LQGHAGARDVAAVDERVVRGVVEDREHVRVAIERELAPAQREAFALGGGVAARDLVGQRLVGAGAGRVAVAERRAGSRKPSAGPSVRCARARSQR
jgi:hypothetical protein